ncbi:MAG: amino acid ABC transporter permease [Chloroflexi bacterium]|nr:amino acid ABC transporter permease [Chloroflexota bacterium]
MSAQPTAPPKTSEATPLVQTRITDRLADFPWWGLFLALMGVLLVYSFTTNATYQNIIVYLIAGIRLTVIVTLVSFSLSIIIGLITAFAQMSEGSNIFSVIARNLATLYVQIIRGIPVIVLIFYTALVIIPASINLLNSLGDWMVSMGWLAADNALSSLTSRGVSFVIRGIIALAINYGAFSSEVFRSGIQSIEKGQLEASNALGLSWFQTMRYVVMPQALRRIMPPLGNDFISMLKESSLVSVLGVGEITQLGKKYSAASFLYPQTYNTVAFLYLSITLILSMGVKYMERRMAVSEET